MRVYSDHRFPSPSFLSHLGSFPFHLSPPSITQPFSISITVSISPSLANLFLPLPPLLPLPLSLSLSLPLSRVYCSKKKKSSTGTSVCVCTCVIVSHYGRTVSEALTQSRAREEVRYLSISLFFVGEERALGEGHGCAKHRNQNTGSQSVASQSHKYGKGG